MPDTLLLTLGRLPKALDIMLGAIDRVTGFTLAARALATESLVLDAGNILFEHESIAPEALAQELRKTQVLMAAHGAAEPGFGAPGYGPEPGYGGYNSDKYAAPRPLQGYEGSY